jgi:hypothetical protein
MCCKRSRGKESFWFEKPGAHAQTLKSEDNSAVRIENRGSGAIAPIFSYKMTRGSEKDYKANSKATIILSAGERST